MASAFEGLRVPPEIVIWIHDNFDDNLRKKRLISRNIRRVDENVLNNIHPSNILTTFLLPEQFLQNHQAAFDYRRH